MRIRSAHAAPLASIAAELGYADQAHLTREFKSFAGITPGLIHGDGTSSPNHLVPTDIPT